MRIFDIRYYADFTRSTVATRTAISVNFAALIEALPLMHLFSRNMGLLIDITDRGPYVPQSLAVQEVA